MFDFDFIIENCEVIKAKYQEFLSPFFDAQKVYELRRLIYTSNLSLYRKDTLWEMLNDDISTEEFKEIAKSKN